MPAKKNGKNKSVRSTDQYHHFIPRFILRRFQVGPVRSKAERQREFKRTGINPEHVLYYDIAAGTLDTRPIGKVYGVLNLYGDKHNQENVNELEEKLAILEREAAVIIKDMHEALPAGKFCLKRRPLEALRKFLFIMHYRQAVVAPVYFQEDHPQNAGGRQWIEHFKKSRGLESAIDVWVYMLRYYLDHSHSQLMLLAAGVVDKYDIDNIFNLATGSQIPHDIEDFPAVTYQSLAGGFFMCIWEAAEGEEFVLPYNGFGLWEGGIPIDGKVDGRSSLHRIFVMSPRIVVVLRSTILRPENIGLVRAPMFSSLLDIAQDPPIATYAGGNSGIEGKTVSEVESYRTSKQAEEDLFTFTITKLSPSQTTAVNNVFLKNVAAKTSLTFLSKDCMLRTARAFCSNIAYYPEIPKFTSLIQLLSSEAPVPNKAAAGEGDPLELVDVELFKLLMDISADTKTFVSAYDRAKAVLAVVERKRYSASEFASQYHRQVTAAYDTFRRDCSGDNHNLGELPGAIAPLLETIPSNISALVFGLLVPIMRAAGFKQMPAGKSDLETLQAEVAVVGFLERVSRNLEAWYKLMTSSKDAASVLSKLFKRNTPSDSFVGSFLAFTRSESGSGAFESEYNKTYTLHRAICVSGPTTNPLSSYCASWIATTTLGFSVFRPTDGDARPNARLAQKLPQAQWTPVMEMMKDIFAQKGYKFSPGAIGDPQAERQRIADEVVVFGTIDWLARNRFNMLDNFCRSCNISLIQLVVSGDNDTK
ncbi:hypothetical protein HYDPIDRAFT_114761 [Hydnomerulius pinastri MD-312]|uniref:DUF4238 domain-containing protein n=1 Tax=Hydnomerulius pinastri MD-312 TaxID=994086 RepID=A0A0C9V9B8_9AGAM|nr:hypothetical protein HYDPIDRAFT_114761 [Hydnomerulius pinastri MD-312]